MTGAQTGAPEDTGLSAEEFSALAERFSAVAPLLRGVFPAAPEPPPERGVAQAPAKKKDNRREALLCALKPYLSPERREMADYLIRICRVYDALTGLF